MCLGTRPGDRGAKRKKNNAAGRHIKTQMSLQTQRASHLMILQHQCGIELVIHDDKLHRSEKAYVHCCNANNLCDGNTAYLKAWKLSCGMADPLDYAFRICLLSPFRPSLFCTYLHILSFPCFPSDCYFLAITCPMNQIWFPI